MSLKKKYAILLFILIILYAIPAALAADFSASSDYRQLTLCRGDSFKDTITVTNTGQTASVFSIGTSESWTEPVPSGFIIGPSGSREVVNFIRPPLLAGNYELTTSIRSGTTVKELMQSIEVRNCENTKVDVFQQKAVSCPCTPSLYVFNITNTGNFIETYDLGVSLEPSFYTLSENPVIVSPGRTQAVYAYFRLPCGQYGRVNLDFTTMARLSGEKTDTGFYLDIDRGCYDYSMAAGKVFNLSSNISSAPFVQSPSLSYDLCYGTEYEIPIKVMNSANVSNEFQLSSDLPMDGNKMVLPPGTSAYTYVLVQDLEPGIYNKAVNSVSLRGNIVKSQALDINISGCGHNVSMKPSAPVPLKRFRITLYILSIMLFILLLLLAINFSSVKRWMWKKEQKKIAAGKTPGSAKRFIATNKKSIIMIILTVLLVLIVIALYFLLRHFGIDIAGFERDIFLAVFAFLRLHVAYLVADLVLLAIVVACIIWLPKLVLHIMRMNKERRDRMDIVLERYPSEKGMRGGMWMFMIVIVIVVFFLVSSLCFFTTVCRNVGLDINIINSVNATNQTQMNETAGYIFENSTVYIWNKNKVKKIDLSQYIINEDDVALQYIFTPVGNITVQVSGEGVVTLTPDRGWFGHRLMNFIIDDGRGNRVISPDINLYVLDVDKTPLDRVKDFLAAYMIYFIIGLLLIVIAVILLVLFVNKPGKKKKILVRRKSKSG